MDPEKGIVPEKPLLADKEPLEAQEPAPTQSRGRPAWLRLRLIAAAVLAVLALGYQLKGLLGSFDHPQPHHRVAIGGGPLADWAYADRLAAFGRVHTGPSNDHNHGHGKTRLSREQVQHILLSVPHPDSAKRASKQYTNRTHVAGTPGDRDVALLIKSQWEQALGADPDPENRRVYDAGTEDSRCALTGRGGRRHHHHHHGKHEHKKHKHRGKHGKHDRTHGQIESLRRYIAKIYRKVQSKARRILPARFKHSQLLHHPSAPPFLRVASGAQAPRGCRRANKPRVWTDTYYSLLNYPAKSALTLTPPGASEPSWQAKLKEDVFPEDPTSGEGVGIWHGFSKNGTAKGQLVYASRGTKEDFEYLAEKGIDVKGKIVAVQYGGSFRGLKVKAAAEAGAVACIIFTDPIEDGEVIESASFAAYPAGPARAPSSVQRGSVQYLSLYPGDPLTPGKPSYNPELPNAPPRLPRDSEGVNVPSIPSLPLSYEDAVPLLKSLNGRGMRLEDGRQGKREGWKEGGLRDRGVEYWTGPGEEEVELVNIVDEKVTPIWNTYGLIPGETDEVVVLGNHHDAWTFGAGDPNSGTASVHETVRALGALLEKGWRPLRTILLAAWDAEEFGLIGSTEFAEDFPEWLQEHVVAYLNVDVSVAGSVYDLGASPSLADLLRDVSAQVPDPDRKGKSLADAREDEGGRPGLEVVDVAPLGSGSDFTGFLQRLGLASANFGMRRGRNEPVYHYHSNFDSFHWQSTYGDPTYERHVAISRVLGLTAVRLADDLVLPINVTAYAVELGRYLDKVAADPLADQIDLAHLRTEADKILKAAQRLAARADSLVAQTQLGGPACCRRGHRHRGAQLRRINRALKDFEGGFLGDLEGLPGREWYRHLGVAPGRWLGYGATTLPGLTEALALDKDVDRARIEVRRLEKAFKTIIRTLEAGIEQHH
ncbi:hypothetical protein JCM8202_003603 [Rhodotorula sphaerocarpa]